MDKKISVKKSSSGLGLFANIPFKKKQFIIEYIGEIITQDEANRRGGKYLFEANSRWTIDGKGRNNIARYINHSCKPNCETYGRGKQVKIRAMKNIKPGEELTYDYQEEYFNEHIKHHGCRCSHCRTKAKK